MTEKARIEFNNILQEARYAFTGGDHAKVHDFLLQCASINDAAANEKAPRERG